MTEGYYLKTKDVQRALINNEKLSIRSLGDWFDQFIHLKLDPILVRFLQSKLDEYTEFYNNQDSILTNGYKNLNLFIVYKSEYFEIKKHNKLWMRIKNWLFWHNVHKPIGNFIKKYFKTHPSYK